MASCQMTRESLLAGGLTTPPRERQRAAEHENLHFLLVSLSRPPHAGGIPYPSTAAEQLLHVPCHRPQGKYRVSNGPASLVTPNGRRFQVSTASRIFGLDGLRFGIFAPSRRAY